MSDRFAGQWALVTGAGSGIGEATSAALVARGAKVWLVDRDAERIAAVQQRLGAERTRTATVDVSDREAMRALAERVHAETGPLSILVNNAGYAVVGSAFETTLEQWEQQLSVNLMGVIYGAQLFGPQMAEAPGPASIVNTASAAGLTGLPMMSAYSVSKCAVVAYSQSLGAEHDVDRLHVMAVCPGFLPTRIGEDADYAGRFTEGRRNKRVKRMINREGRRPEEVADAILGGIERRSPLVHVYSESWQLELVSRLLPRRVLHRFKRKSASKLGR